MIALSLLFGMIVGFSLGLTGGGGSILAVPLLVYGLSVAPREAIGISLVAVGATALLGALQRLLTNEVDLRVGGFFALAGMLGAPLGAWLNRYIPEPLLLTCFAGLMLFVAVRMWRQVSLQARTPLPRHPPPTGARNAPGSRLPGSARETGILALLGLATGVLSGLFGVGGGFVIVPALVRGSHMPIHRAVATSLVVIALVSAAGVTSYLVAGQQLG
jgi:uncharacterized membrane protein YfcA